MCFVFIFEFLEVLCDFLLCFFDGFDVFVLSVDSFRRVARSFDLVVVLLKYYCLFGVM